MDSIEWAAGLFEGEGCFSLHKSSPRKDGRIRLLACLSICSTDRDVLERFLDVIKCGTIGTMPITPPSKKRRWQIHVYSDNAIRIGELFKPFLGQRRLLALKRMINLHGSFLDTI